MNVQPSEAWHLDVVEINKLSKQKSESSDVSVMLNYERMQNGASKEWLTKNH